MKVFDCFTFFNELDLLEFRLKYLDNTVDHFVIAESNLTHSGRPKPYYFREAKERFRQWEHKIIYIPVHQKTEGLVFEEQTTYSPGSAEWKLENEQRNALLAALPQMQEEDLVLLGDLDEIPSRPSIQKAKILRKPLSFSLLFHFYYLNCQHTGRSRWWQGTIASTAKQFREISPQGLRDKRDEYPALPRAGWHFSYLGGAEKIMEKLVSSAHSEYNRPEFCGKKEIELALAEGKDILKREGVSFRYMPLSYYPLELQRVMRQYPFFLHDVKTDPLNKLYFTGRRILKRQY